MNSLVVACCLHAGGIYLEVINVEQDASEMPLSVHARLKVDSVLQGFLPRARVRIWPVESDGRRI